MTRPLRIGVRTRLLLAAVGAVAIALVVGVTAFNLVLGQRLSASAASLARAQAAAESSSLEVVHGRVVAPGVGGRSPVASPVWIFSGTTAVETPRASGSLTAVATSLAGGPERTVRFHESVRLYALPVVRDGKRVGTVVAGVPLEAYSETATIALVGSIGLALALLAAVALLSHWILGKALLPVSRMTDDAAEWSDHDLDRRFNRGEPYDELTRLAATLDAMLERLSASLRHEQRFTAELSHELRTPLAKIAAESELALRRERTEDDYRGSLTAVQRNAEQMTRTVEALLAAARQEAGLTRTTSDAREGVEAAVAAVRGRGGDSRDRRQALAAPAPRPRCDRGRSARADRPSAARQRAPLRPRAGHGRAAHERSGRLRRCAGRRRRESRRTRSTPSSSRVSVARLPRPTREARASGSCSPAVSRAAPAARSSRRPAGRGGLFSVRLPLA